MEKMIFTLTEQMKDAMQLLQRTVTNKKVSGGVYPEGGVVLQGQPRGDFR